MASVGAEHKKELLISTMSPKENHLYFLNFISFLATITTIAVAFSGITICAKIRRKGGVGDISPAPFIAGVINALLWIKYALLADDGTILFVNTVNCILNTTYITYYFSFLQSKLLLYKYIFLTTMFILPVYIYSALSTDGIYVEWLVGVLASGAAIAFCAAPLAQMQIVLKNKSTESMSFFMALTTFLMGIEWFIYGYLVSDMFVMVPNFLGAILGGVQLHLFYKFPASKPTKGVEQGLPLTL